MNNFASEFNILVVDDISTNVTLVQTILKKEGYSLLTATRGIEALEIAHNQHPQLILLDIMMPEMDGFEVLQRLKSNPETTNIPVMIMSALTDFKDIVKGYQLGAIEYITKPFNRDELLKRISHRFELFSIGRMKRELEIAIETREMAYSLITKELRSPIGSIRMMSESLLQETFKESLDNPTRFILLEIHRKSEEASLLIDNMLNISKNRYKQQKPYKQYSDFNSMINHLLDIYEPIAELKNIRFIKENLDNEMMASFDIDMMKTVIRNLISNAVKFSFEGGIIHITTQIEKENQIVFCIADSGRGIKKEDKKKILQKDSPFTTFGTADEAGLGMGLLLSKNYIECHQGNLWFETEEDKGTHFYFTIKDSVE